MIRVFLFFVALAAVALGINWIAAQSGSLAITWHGYEYRVSVLVGLIAFLVAAVLLGIVWRLLRLIVGMPTIVSHFSKARQRKQGFVALTRGMVAVGAGDGRSAARHSEEASRLLHHEPLALLLKAQAAQLGGDRAAARASFGEMLDAPETRLLGLRGLHMEARRQGDAEGALRYAEEAQKLAPLPWAGQAVLEYRATQNDWEAALAAVERNASGRIIDKPTARRQRAVLKTAIAIEKADREPEAAMALAKEAIRVAPDLVPASLLMGRLLTRFGDIRKAIKVLEANWKLAPHPDVAEAYLGVRPGDSARDRLLRAERLADLVIEHPESHLTLARAALEVRDFDRARKAMLPIFDGASPYGRPTVRACLLMADLEEAAGSPGRAREWLARASRAARDPAWVADGIVSDHWSPVSPGNGRLDAFVWRQPAEQVSGPPPAPYPALDSRDAEPPQGEEMPLAEGPSKNLPAVIAVDPLPPAPAVEREKAEAPETPTALVRPETSEEEKAESRELTR